MRTKEILKEIGLITIKNLPFGRTSTDLFEAVQRLQSNEESLDHEINQAIEALGKSSQLVATLETKLKDREANLSKLSEDYERIKALKSLTDEQALAVSQHLNIALDTRRPRDIVINALISLVVGVLIFLIGVFASEPIKTLVQGLFN